MTTVTADARISLLSPLVPVAAPPPVSRRDADPWDQVLQELRRLGQLEDDWDGQGAATPEPANVGAATRWVEEMRRWPSALLPTLVVPGTTGEIVLEWRAEKFYLAAEVSRPDRIEWALNLPGEPLRQWETDSQRTWIVTAER